MKSCAYNILINIENKTWAIIDIYTIIHISYKNLKVYILYKI